jgi:ABC-type transport system substrate-binding protein
MVLAVVLVTGIFLTGCPGEPVEYWHTPEGEKISFDVTTMGDVFGDIGLMVVEDLQDFGLDVEQIILDSGTFYDYFYLPNEGQTEASIFADSPSPDPWGDWIWQMLADPETYGYLWNPSWYTNTDYDDLYLEIYTALNLSAREEVLFGLQEILNEDVPVHFLVRDEFIAVHRTDNWGGWYNEMGGYVSWINEHSIREATQLGSETQLKIGVLAMVPNLNMEQAILFYTDVGLLYCMLVYENLVFYPKIGEDLGATYDFVPKLVTNFTVTYEPDGAGGQNQVWTIKLREGVKWHDYDTSGEYWSADDMIYSMRYMQDHWRNNKSMNWTAIDENGGVIIPEEHVLATKTGEYEVEWRYIEGHHQNEEYIPSFYLWDQFVPEHVFNAEGAPEDPQSWPGNSTGTGPYEVKEFVEGSHLLLERFDDYWGPLPEAEEVLFRLFTDRATLFLALEAGEIDGCIASAPFPKIAAYDADPDIEVEVVKDLRIYYMVFNLHPTAGYAPLQDKVLRKAIAYAIDEQDIVDLALGGYAEVAYTWVYNEDPYLYPGLTEYEFNPTTARDMLLAANYTFHS